LATWNYWVGACEWRFAYSRLKIFVEVEDGEYFMCALNLRTFGNMSKKLWPNM